jgi:hypothetical protein
MRETAYRFTAVNSIDQFLKRFSLHGHPTQQTKNIFRANYREHPLKTFSSRL